MKRNEKNESREERLLSLLKHALPGKIIDLNKRGLKH